MPRPRRRWIVWGFAGLLVFAGMLAGLYFAIASQAQRARRAKLSDAEFAAYRVWRNEVVEVSGDDLIPPPLSDETVQRLLDFAEVIVRDNRDLDRWGYLDLLSQARRGTPNERIDEESLAFFDDMLDALRALVQRPDYEIRLHRLSVEGVSIIKDTARNFIPTCQWARAAHEIRQHNGRAALDEIEVLLQFAKAHPYSSIQEKRHAAQAVEAALDAIEELEAANDQPEIAEAIRELLRRHAEDVRNLHLGVTQSAKVEDDIGIVRSAAGRGFSIPSSHAATGPQWQKLAEEAFFWHGEWEEERPDANDFFWEARSLYEPHVSGAFRNGTYVLGKEGWEVDSILERYERMMNSPVPASGS
ncbi:hypothetical protein KQI84_08920 [bacterium]|nr:hypothetical protein [bacterium]